LVVVELMMGVAGKETAGELVLMRKECNTLKGASGWVVARILVFHVGHVAVTELKLASLTGGCDKK
jgi:hypothetical protein